MGHLPSGPDGEGDLGLGRHEEVPFLLGGPLLVDQGLFLGGVLIVVLLGIGLNQLPFFSSLLPGFISFFR